MGGNNSRGSNLGVMTNNAGAVSDIDRLLSTLGGDCFLAVLNCGDVSDSLANSLADLSWGVNGNLVTLCDWDTVTNWGGNGNWGSNSISMSTISSIGISISIGLSISFTLSISSMGNTTIPDSTNSSDSTNSTMSNSTNSTISSTNSTISSTNSTISSNNTGGNTMSNSPFWASNNSGSNNLGVMSYDTRGTCGMHLLLGTLGGGDSFTVFSDGGVNNCITLFVANLSGLFNLSWDTSFYRDRDRVTHRSRNRSSYISHIIAIASISISFRIGICLTPDQESLGESNTAKDGEKFHFEVCRRSFCNVRR